MCERCSKYRCVEKTPSHKPFESVNRKCLFNNSETYDRRQPDRRGPKGGNLTIRDEHGRAHFWKTRNVVLRGYIWIHSQENHSRQGDELVLRGMVGGRVAASSLDKTLTTKKTCA